MQVLVHPRISQCWACCTHHTDMNFRDTNSHSVFADFYGVAWDRTWRWLEKKKWTNQQWKLALRTEWKLKVVGLVKPSRRWDCRRMGEDRMWKYWEPLRSPKSCRIIDKKCPRMKRSKSHKKWWNHKRNRSRGERWRVLGVTVVFQKPGKHCR